MQTEARLGTCLLACCYLCCCLPDISQIEAREIEEQYCERRELTERMEIDKYEIVHSLYAGNPIPFQPKIHP